jgi:ribosomal protein S18 acetylase RimI-like enzyme
MITLRIRPYLGDIDLQPLVELFNACEAVDRLDDHVTTTDLRLEFSDPSLDPERDLSLWEDANGNLIGFGHLWIRQSGEEADGWLWFRVHPQARYHDLEFEIITWGEKRLQEIGQAQGVPVNLRTGCRDHLPDRIQILEKAGFVIDREFLTMSRSLIVPLAEAPLPQGFTLTYIHNRAEMEAWVDLYNESFIDHWNHHHLTIDEHCYWLDNDPNYQPNLDLVAIAPDGTFAAFCLCRIDREYNSDRGCHEGWISSLGTRRGFRRMGLGRSMLIAGMQHLWQTGIDTAKLGVDTQNPNCALHLYESVGFRRLHRRLSYVKPLS